MKRAASKTRWPHQLRVAGVRVGVSYSQKATKLAGSFSEDFKRICVDGTMAPGVRFHTLIHELLHAWWWLHRDAGAKKRQISEEDAVSLFSGAVASLLLENPSLRRLAASLQHTHTKAVVK